MQDVEDAQSPEGGFSDVCPRLVDLSDGAPAWARCRHHRSLDSVSDLWRHGDFGKHWAAMTRWMDYHCTSANPNGLWINRRNTDFGDWLSIAADTPKDVLATAYYAYDAALMARMARALGRAEKPQKYDSSSDAYPRGVQRSLCHARWPDQRRHPDRLRACPAFRSFAGKSSRLGRAASGRRHRGQKQPSLDGLRRRRLSLPDADGDRPQRHRLQATAQRYVPFLGLLHQTGRDDDLGTLGRLHGRTKASRTPA